MSLPNSADPIVEHARGVIERGSLSFALAARALDPVTRASGFQLYAWCRHCDDLIDGQTFGHEMRVPKTADQRRLLAELKATTEQALRGEPVSGLVFQGIARVVRQHGIPPHHLFEFLAGMEMDVDGRRYRTLDELVPYCYRVAGVVGVMMGHIMGIKDAATLERAGDLGTAMQFTNIARDVLDDARAGRVYLPTSWLAEAGIPEDRVGDPKWRAAVGALVSRLLDCGDELYRRADTGIEHLAFRPAWSIQSARLIYSEIGTVIRRRDTHAWDTRSSVRGSRKLWLVAVALGRTAFGRVRQRIGR